MAPAYKLYYFNVRGVAEGIRYLFKYGNIEFEDVRITKEEWAKLKERVPFGQMPFIEYKGKTINQSIAIYRYLGRILKLTGKDDWENLEIDEVTDTLSELRQLLSSAHLEEDETKKQAAKKAVINETIPFYFTRLDARVKQNNGYFVGGRLTWVDLVFASLASGFDNFVGGNPFEKYPHLQALREKVEALPAIKKWIEIRPDCIGSFWDHYKIPLLK